MVEEVILFSWDLETHRITPGILAPPGVVGAHAVKRLGEPMSEAKVELRWFTHSLEAFEAALRDPNTIIVGANIMFDLAVAAVKRPDLLPLIFAKLDAGLIHDILICTTLDAIACGHLYRVPETMAPIRDPDTNRHSERYSLKIVVQLILGRFDAKKNNAWVERYHELENVPFEQWPEEARQYPVDDVMNVLEVADKQLADGPEQALNLAQMKLQVKAAFALHMGCVWGLRTDPVESTKLAVDVERRYRDAIGQFLDTGFVRKDGSKNLAEIKKAVAIAYGSTDPCDMCRGTGRVTSEKSGKPINCKVCSGTGLMVAPFVPPTDTGGISYSRDALAESGDGLLEEFAKVSEIEKIKDTYVPFLQQGFHLPINLYNNPVLETGRTSYAGLIQLLPRKGGVRECFRAREGTVYLSIDYSALELSTLGQVCLYVVGQSALADAINSGVDVHALFASKIAATPYEEFKAKLEAKDPVARDQRQMTKAANFGFPGMMGAAKFVLAKRKEGLRLCIAARVAPPCDACQGWIGNKLCRKCYGRGALCGLEKVTAWKKRDIQPTCYACLQTAESLRNAWLEMWPEIREYWKWVTGIDGVQDQQGTLVSPGTGWIRGGLHASNAANHPFQHLASCGAKDALYEVTKEAYTDPRSPLWGTRVVVFAHDELFSEVPKAVLHEAAIRKREIMVASMKKYVPDVRVGAEPAASVRWEKGAEPVYVNGRLVPWEPPPKTEKARERYVSLNEAPF